MDAAAASPMSMRRARPGRAPAAPPRGPARGPTPPARAGASGATWPESKKAMKTPRKPTSNAAEEAATSMKKAGRPRTRASRRASAREEPREDRGRAAGGRGRRARSPRGRADPPRARRRRRPPGASRAPRARLPRSTRLPRPQLTRIAATTSATPTGPSRPARKSAATPVAHQQIGDQAQGERAATCQPSPTRISRDAPAATPAAGAAGSGARRPPAS